MTLKPAWRLTALMTEARIVHAIPGRLRLRISERRGDAVFWDALPRQFGQCPGVVAVSVKPATGSVVLTTGPTVRPDSIIQYAREWLELEISYPLVPRHPSVADTVAAGLGGLDRGLTGLSNGLIDLRSLLFLALVILIVRQVKRGHWSGPVSSLLLSALDITGLNRK